MDDMTPWIRAVALNDQDRCAADEWMRAASEEDKRAVWAYMQMRWPAPVVEIITRFAALGFAETAMRVKGIDYEAK